MSDVAYKNVQFSLIIFFIALLFIFIDLAPVPRSSFLTFRGFLESKNDDECLSCQTLKEKKTYVESDVL